MNTNSTATTCFRAYQRPSRGQLRHFPHVYRQFLQDRGQGSGWRDGALPELAGQFRRAEQHQVHGHHQRGPRPGHRGDAALPVRENRKSDEKEPLFSRNSGFFMPLRRKDPRRKNSAHRVRSEIPAEEGVGGRPEGQPPENGTPLERRLPKGALGFDQQVFIYLTN